MTAGSRRRGREASALFLAIIISGSAPALAGMAELGRGPGRQFLFESAATAAGVSPGEVAAGDGEATLTADGVGRFRHLTSPGEPLSDILTSLILQVNSSVAGLEGALEGGVCNGGLRDGKPCTLDDPEDACAQQGGFCQPQDPVGTCVEGGLRGNPCVLGQPGDECISNGGSCLAPGVCDGGSADGAPCDLRDPVDLCVVGGGQCLGFFEGVDVLRGDGSEVSEISIGSTDTNFGFVKAIRRDGAVSVLAAVESPAGNGSVTLTVNQNDTRSITVPTSPFVGDPESLNQELVSRLQAAGYAVTFDGGNITVTQDLADGEAIFAMSWVDDDLGLHTIGAAAFTGLDPGGIPTLSSWALLVLAGLLGAAALGRMRRRTDEA